MKARTSLAETQQRRWGCPAAGCSPPAKLPPDLDEAAEDHARITGAPKCGTCPFSRRLSPWAMEVLALSRLAERFKGTVTAVDSLGRVPHVWDLAALDALILAQARVDESNAKIAERERKAKEPPR